MNQRPVETGTITMNIFDEGRGPAVLLCHGFPETAYAWRHQISALAEAGFRVTSSDMRGYGGSDRLEAIEEYSLFHLVGAMVALLDSRGIRRGLFDCCSFAACGMFGLMRLIIICIELAYHVTQQR